MNTLHCVALGRSSLIGLLLAAFAPAIATTDVIDAQLVTGLMPEGCGNPFIDASAFFAFYEQTIETAAAKRGPDAKGVSDLFAVSELKHELDILIANPQEESPIDRLINSQLCLFQKVQTAAKMSGVSKTNPLAIPSDNDALHDHLAAVAPKLYRDSRKIMIEVLAEKAKEKQKQSLLQRRWAEVRKARESGRSKIRDLFE